MSQETELLSLYDTWEAKLKQVECGSSRPHCTENVKTLENIEGSHFEAGR
ncbi:MAG: hypothetical protein IAG10_33420 [Planctomycetaceae bacterium]|nr:hypothetical protein [Planctomycetaceae bacterium]